MVEMKLWMKKRKLDEEKMEGKKKKERKIKTNNRKNKKDYEVRKKERKKCIQITIKFGFWLVKFDEFCENLFLLLWSMTPTVCIKESNWGFPYLFPMQYFLSFGLEIGDLFSK